MLRIEYDVNSDSFTDGLAIGPYASRPGSPATGWVYLVTDDATAGDCAGGGSANSMCVWDGSAWSSFGGGGSGGSGDMTKAVYDTNDDGSVGAADTVPWTGISDRPTGLDDGDDDTKIDDGVFVAEGMSLRMTNVSGVYEAYAPELCETNACDLITGTTIDGDDICRDDGTNCPSGVTDTGPIPDGCTAAEAQLGGGGSCADPLLETELDEFSEFLSQIADMTGTPGSGTVLHGDGSWGAVASTFLSLTDNDEADYTGHAGEFVTVNSGEDGIEFHSIVDGDLPAEVAYVDAGNTFSTIQTISATAPELRLKQTDVTAVNFALTVDSNYFSLYSRDASDVSRGYPIRVHYLAPTDSVHVDNAGMVGIGVATPTTLFHVYDGDSSAYATIQSAAADSVGELRLRGIRSGSSGTFGRLAFYNDTDTMASIVVNRDSADDDALMSFLVQGAGGDWVERMRLDPTLSLFNTPLSFGTNAITAVGAVTSSATVTATGFDVPATASDGQELYIKEDSDLGAGTWGFDIASTNLPDADTRCVIDSNGRIPDSCVGDGVDGGGAGGGAGVDNYTGTLDGDTSTTINHDLSTSNVIVICYDGSDVQVFPDTVTIDDDDNVTVTFEANQAGRCVINGSGAYDSELNNLETLTTGIAADEIIYGGSANTAAYAKISTLTEEASPASGDKFLAEDGATGQLRYVDVDNFPTGGESNDLEASVGSVEDDEVFIGTGSGSGTYISVPVCLSSQKIHWDGSTLSCTTDQGTEVNDLEATVTSVEDNEVFVGTAGNDGTYIVLPTSQALKFNGTAFAQATASEMLNVASGALVGADVQAAIDWLEANKVSAELNNLSVMTGVADNQVAVGSASAGVGYYTTVPQCDDADEKIDFDGASFSCVSTKHVASIGGGTTLNVAASTHGLGTGVHMVQCYDSDGVYVGFNDVDFNTTNGDVAITFVNAQTGYCVLR